MRPSGSVTAAAIVALLGSAFVAFFGLIDLLIVGLMSRIGPEAGTLSKQSATILTVGIVGGSLFSFAFAGWGLATGIGLLRLKPWSRISILVYSGFLAALMLFPALSFVLAPLPETLNGDQEFEHIFRIMRLFWLAPLGIVVWWLVLFTRKSVAAQFSGVSQPIVPQQVQFDAGPAIVPRSPPRPQRPIFFTILAWYFVALF